MNKYVASLVHATVLAGAVSQAAWAQVGSVQVESGTAIARRADGRVIWTVTTEDASATSIRNLGKGRYELGSGTILDRRGRVLSRTGSANMATSVIAPVTTYTWDPLALLEPNARYLVDGPVLDGAGNAYVLIDDSQPGSGDLSLKVIRSNGSDGTWGAPVPVPFSEDSIFAPALAVDQAGNVTIVYRGYSALGYALKAIRYTKSGVWQSPVVIADSPAFFQSVHAVADSFSNIVVLFDRAGVATAVFSAADGTWQPVQQLSSVQGEVWLTSLAASKSGNTVVCAYLKLGVSRSVYSHQYSPATRTWGPAEILPASTAAGFTIAGPGSEYPLTADDLGNSTIFVPFYVFRNMALYGYRRESRWKLPEKLLGWGPIFEDILNFGNAVENGAGGVLGAETNSGLPGLQNFTVYRFTPGTGWTTEVADTWSSSTYYRCRIAWLGPTKQQAVGVYQKQYLESAVYDGSTWSQHPDIPGQYGSFYENMATLPAGQVLLVFEADFGSGPELGSLASTWMRP